MIGDVSDLEATLSNWPKDKFKPYLKPDERKALEIMYESSKKRQSTSIHIRVLAEMMHMDVNSLANLMHPVARRFVWDKEGYYSLRADGYEIFESQYTIFARMLTQLFKLQSQQESTIPRDSRDIGLVSLAKAAGFGEYKITLFYLKHLNEQKLVDIRTEERHGGKTFSYYKLTAKGRSLAEYLVKIKKFRS